MFTDSQVETTVQPVSPIERLDRGITVEELAKAFEFYVRAGERTAPGMMGWFHMAFRPGDGVLHHLSHNCLQFPLPPATDHSPDPPNMVAGDKLVHITMKIEAFEKQP